MEQKVVGNSHPLGLRVLFTTEMWERFNFYGMRALLTLFLVNALAFSEKDASILYGGFLGLCYLTPMIGGYISDRFLGNRNCIQLGGLTMGVGQILLFFSALLATSTLTDGAWSTKAATFISPNLGSAKSLMWIGLGLLILGNGLFKPNISSMVGSLYPKGDSRLDSAFTIFYMGINVGALLGMTICPFIGDVKQHANLSNEIRILSAFKWGFLAAGMAMFLGVIVFMFLKNKYIVTPDGKALGGRPSFGTNNAIDIGDAVQEADKANFSTKSIVTALILLIISYLTFQYVSIDSKITEAGASKLAGLSGLTLYIKTVLLQNPIKMWIYPLIYGSGLTLAFLILSDKSLTKVERDRIIALYIVAFFVIFFWAAFEQAGSSLTFIADNQTNTKVFGVNLPASFIQNANSIFVIVFALPLSFLWSSLAKKNKEPISPVKQAIGLLLLSVGYIIIAFQVKDLGSAKMGVIWLIVMYLFHTLGELCLSPIGLSLVSKLAPARFSSLLMGVWFLSNASGYALAGTLGSILPATTDKYNKAKEMGLDLQAILDKKTIPTADQLSKLNASDIPTSYTSFMGFELHNLFDFFMVFVVLSAVAGFLLIGLSRLLKKLMHGVN